MHFTRGLNYVLGVCRNDFKRTQEIFEKMQENASSSQDYSSYLVDENSSYSGFSYETIGSSTCQQTEEQLINLQTEILQQAQQVDSYIAGRAKKEKKSDSFIALQHLYSLFKQELNLNFSIRRALVQEKQLNEQATIQCAEAKNQINLFLTKLSQDSDMQYSSLKQVTARVSQIINQQNDGRSIRSIQNENKKLKKQIESLSTEIEEMNAQKAMEMAEMQAKIDIAEDSSNKLKEKIAEMERNKQNEFEQYAGQLRKQQAFGYQELCDTKQKLSESCAEVNKLKNSLEKAMKELEDLQTKKAEAELAKTYKDALQKTQKELLNKTNQMKHLKKERNALVKCVNEQKIIHDASVQRIDDLQEKLNKIELKYKSICKQNNIRSQRRVRQNVSYNDRFDQVDGRLEEENRRLQNELRDAYSNVRKLEAENSKLFREVESLQNDLSNARKLCQYGQIGSFRDGIVEAFDMLRNGLGLDRRSTPDRVVQYVLSLLKPYNQSPSSSPPSQYSVSRRSYDDSSSQNSIISTDKSSSICTNDIQAQIDSLQNEVLSLKGEVTKFTQ